MKFIITEEEKNRIKTLYTEQGIMDKVKDHINPKNDKTFIKDTTILPINKRVDFYDYTKTKTLKGVTVKEGVYYFNNVGDGYLTMKARTGDGKDFMLYATCIEDGNKFNPSLVMNELDYKKILNLTDPMSKPMEFGDGVWGDFVDVTNSGFSKFLEDQMNAKKNKTFCKSKVSDFTSKDDTTGSDVA